MLGWSYSVDTPYLRLSHAMRTTSDPSQLHAWASVQKDAGQTIAIVPTMGFLHEGHLSLIRLACARGDKVVASIFVNPTQFGPNEDLERYPRDLEGDLNKLRSAGVDVAFVPEPESMYPDGFDTYIEPSTLGSDLCGATRPGHFRGVCTVVALLLRMSQADLLVLGEKDYQQLTIVRRMIRDLWLGVEVIAGPTVREPDGLAMSSRNKYLSQTERAWALAIPRALDRVATQFAQGDRSVSRLMHTASGTLDEVPLDVEYIRIVDAESLRPLTTINGPALIAIAARSGSTRLIDNRLLDL
ncbi:MAG: pantoate--beta-alanine ligase [Myxococcota bacterium]